MRAVVAAFALALATSPAAGAEHAPYAPPARLAVVIDDLGIDLAAGQRVIRLPGPVTCAILPHQPHSTAIAEAAHAARREVLLHLPMEPEREGEADPGPGQIDTGMPTMELRVTLDSNLKTVPHAAGLNNHMGSRYTRQAEPMRRLLDVMRERGHLFFLDSRTSGESVAYALAQREGVPALARDVFLDNDRSEKSIEAQLDLALQLARRRGAAVAIGHPYPETLAVLERRLPGLRAAGIELVTLTDQLTDSTPEKGSWPAFSSH